MRRAPLPFATLFSLALAPALAAAKDLPAGGMTIEDVISWLQDAGYQAKVITNTDASRTITSAAEGSAFHIDLHDCNGDTRCASRELFTGFDTHGAFNTEKMSEWNSRNRWVRASVDNTDDPWIEMDPVRHLAQRAPQVPPVHRPAERPGGHWTGRTAFTTLRPKRDRRRWNSWRRESRGTTKRAGRVSAKRANPALAPFAPWPVPTR